MSDDRRPTREEALAKARSGCRLYDEWFQEGYPPNMDGAAIAYEVVSHLRDLIAYLEGSE